MSSIQLEAAHKSFNLYAFSFADQPLPIFWEKSPGDEAVVDVE